MAEVASSSSPWRWGALWLGVAAVLLIGSAAVSALPVLLESSPGERADAVRHLWPTVLVLVLAGAGAGIGSAGCMRRVSAEPRGALRT